MHEKVVREAFVKSPLNALGMAGACLVALWLMAWHGYAAMPIGASRAAALIFSSAILIASGVFKVRWKHYAQAMFVWSMALACWAFFAERAFILPQGDPRLIHAITVYNMFRYFLLLVCFFIFIKDAISALRDLS
jgi:hypothetical protein